uniref:J domain-containing protein n=1 Tax=Ditylenchus dipsaci TaxID=166011 RepID=A0A915D6Q0_9BILA
MKYKYFFLMLGFLCFVQGSSPSAGDPYNVMRIKRTATPREVKQAYKKLAMEWHPDKNDSPEASEKFMAINQAYEVLSDPTKKERYDRFGTFDTGHPHEHQHNDFDHFFNFGGFSKPGGSSFDAHRITFRMYMNSLLEKSHTQPFIIYAYSSYCQMCFLLEPVWKDAVTDLESLGYGIGTVNYLTDGNLFEKLRITHLPSIVVLVEGRVVHFRGNMNGLTSKAIRLFARDAIPNTFLFKLNTYDALRRFLDQWEATNKPSILMLGSKEEPRLRYLLAAMKFSHFARFAYICINNAHSDVVEMKKALNIQCSDCENIFVFKENPESGPLAKLISDDRQFSTQEISALIEKNKFIEMPRLSSMGFFDELCPISSRSVKHFCVILPVFDVASDQKYVKAMRKFVQTYDDQLTKERVHISSVFIDKQKEFVNEFKHVLPINEEKRSILVLWRYEYVKAKYSWIPSVWSVDPEIMHKSFETLKEHLYLLSRGTLRMDHTAKIVSLVDEYAPTWFTSFSRTLVRMAETVWFHITKEEALPILSVMGTLLFIFFVGYGLNYLVADSAKTRQFQKEKTPFPTEQKEWHPEDPKTASTQRSSSTATQPGKNYSAKTKIWREMEPMIHELRAETYFGLIRLLKPGCRSIIILVDPDSKDFLLPQFARHMYPLRNNKTFSFGFLMVNKNLAFFRSLLEHTLPGDEDNTKDKANTSAAVNVDNASASLLTRERLKEINPKQTLGTVLVLCGWKLYFSVYHPMHSTSRSKNYVGFECSDDEDLSSDCGDTKVNTGGKKQKILKKDLNVENVLNGMSSFLDRLLEGSIRRYYVPEWPDNLK